jgi:hypothetical protein
MGGDIRPAGADEADKTKEIAPGKASLARLDEDFERGVVFNPGALRLVKISVEFAFHGVLRKFN